MEFNILLITAENHCVAEQRSSTAQQQPAHQQAALYCLPGTVNIINGTQRTEQSEVYGTKKEEKREKRRKLV